MKKIVLFVVGLSLLSGCSFGKSATTNSTASTEDSSITTSTDAETSTTPDILQGTWMGADNSRLIIDKTTLSVNGITYDILEYHTEDNRYTFLWDVSKIENSSTPKPFVYTYDPEADQLISDIIYNRK